MPEHIERLKMLKGFELPSLNAKPAFNFRAGIPGCSIVYCFLLSFGGGYALCHFLEYR
jgi:hypothetical protein